MSRHRFSRARRTGFTIVELTIVLVVIGLLLSGILKGQELINGAKIRAIVDRQNSLIFAWSQFVARYGAKPGDYAGTDIPYATPSDSDTRGNGVVERGESTLAMEHLALAGEIRNCQQCIDGNRDLDMPNPPDAENSLTNQYGGVISIWHDETYYVIRGGNIGVSRLQIHTGPRIPSNILAEVDRKIDDGLANSGRMVLNAYDPTEPTIDLPAFFMACTGTSDLMSTVAISYLPADEGIEANCGAGIFI